MASEYDNHGVHFLYPENWAMSEEDAAELPRIVSLESPEGALWTLAIHPASGDPAELAASVLATLEGEEDYVDFDIEPIEESLSDLPAVGYELQFFCKHQVVSARIRSIALPQATLLVLCQAQDREFEQLEPVFRAITHSLLSDTAGE